MKGLDLKSTKDLIRLREEVNKILSNRIDESKRNDIINKVDELPVGTINCLFESVSDKLYSTKRGKSLIGKYVRAIKENKTLCKEFSLYNFVRYPKCVNDANLYLSEAVKLCGDVRNSKCLSAENKMKQIVKECLIETNATTEEIQNVIDAHKINEDVKYILKNTQTWGNLDVYTDKFSNIVKHINENKPTQVVSESNDKSVKELVGELNETFNNDLKEWENRVIKDLSYANMANADKKVLFETYKKDCLDALNEHIDESSVEDKSQMFAMKTQLESKQYNADTIVDDLFKFSELKSVISEMK